MAKVARMTDMWSGICCCHSKPPCIGMQGTIITASPTHTSGNLNVGRLSDMVMGFCGHVGTIVTASSLNISNGLGKARVGDQVSGCTIGQIITGNSTHDTN
jgi:hypothetical protein